MGLRFRKSFKLFPGARINIGLRGVSASFGVPGARVTVGRRGTYGTVGIPGSGLSFTQRLDKREPARGDGDVFWPDEDTPVFEPPPAPALVPPPKAGRGQQPQPMREIASAGAYRLTSPSLMQLRDTLMAAQAQMHEVEDDLAQATQQQRKFETELARKRKSLFRAFYRRRIRQLDRSLVPRATEEVESLTQWQAATRIAISFESGETEQQAWDSLAFAFDKLRTCSAIWDIMRDADIDQARERSSAGRAIEREEVELGFATHRLIAFDGPALRFGNANGEAITLFPGFAVVEGAGGAIALVDQRDIAFEFSGQRFVEDDTVPSDARVVDQTWLKVNKNGTPDKRFAGNRQIPVCLYGKMTFSTPTGLNEEYQFSDPLKAQAFADAMNAYRIALGA
jgi:hypothetical protein